MGSWRGRSRSRRGWRRHGRLQQAAREFQERYNGPLIALRNTLPPERYSALMTQLEELVDQFNQATDGTVAIDVEYLLVVASKP